MDKGIFIYSYHDIVYNCEKQEILCTDTDFFFFLRKMITWQKQVAEQCCGSVCNCLYEPHSLSGIVPLPQTELWALGEGLGVCEEGLSPLPSILKL